ncbi:nitroreductase family protein [Listeria aquatica]|uniref:Nitroreductase n=1 Tax=Listeria aquatica FSL S10-1188 TaxID=1265818 RepID=W7B7U1_9LIST|nr:nitroreductase family protein [Listeria aquatica]EUJ18951.1 nitroreductase [Listeria aquatica FSL S10-1188]
MSELKQVIVERRSVKQISGRKIDRSLVEEIVELAAFAPFHSKVEPWQIYVIQDAKQKEKLVRAVTFSRNDGTTFEQVEEMLERKFLTAPVILIVTSALFQDSKKDFESVAATSAFIQNLQLAAWESGIGTIWRTPKFLFQQAFCEALQIGEEEMVMGILPLTFLPDDKPDVKTRRKLSEYLHEL